mgnify:CR=1 FL=1
MYFEYRIVKIEKGLFLIEHRSTPDGTWQEVKDKQFKTKPKAEAWARILKVLNLETKVISSEIAVLGLRILRQFLLPQRF